MATDYNDYSDLEQTGFEDKRPVDPKDEFFHSVYISGVTRQNQEGITEHTGKLQIRGVEYNKDEVHFILIHTKQILAKIEREPTGTERTKCFSYQDGPPPWFGSYQNHKCGTNSAERAADQWCKECRAQLIVAGVYCSPEGKPILNEEGKPTFVFIRGRGMKYQPVADYLSELAGMELEPIFTPVTEESRRFEKSVVNNKRFVTGITIGDVQSNYGPKKVFILKAGTTVPNETVLEILKIAKKTVDKFKDKFDWSKNATANYADNQPSTEGLEQIPDSPKQDQGTEQASPEKPEEKESPKPPSGKQYSFEDLDF